MNMITKVAQMLELKVTSKFVTISLLAVTIGGCSFRTLSLKENVEFSIAELNVHKLLFWSSTLQFPTIH